MQVQMLYVWHVFKMSDTFSIPEVSFSEFFDLFHFLMKCF